VRFLDVADGSLEELKYYFVLAQDLKYQSPALAEPLLKQCELVGRMLSGLRGHVNQEAVHARV